MKRRARRKNGSHFSICWCGSIQQQLQRRIVTFQRSPMCCGFFLQSIRNRCQCLRLACPGGVCKDSRNTIRAVNTLPQKRSQSKRSIDSTKEFLPSSGRSPHLYQRGRAERQPQGAIPRSAAVQLWLRDGGQCDLPCSRDGRRQSWVQQATLG